MGAQPAAQPDPRYYGAQPAAQPDPCYYSAQHPPPSATLAYDTRNMAAVDRARNMRGSLLAAVPAEDERISRMGGSIHEHHADL